MGQTPLGLCGSFPRSSPASIVWKRSTSNLLSVLRPQRTLRALLVTGANQWQIDVTGADQWQINAMAFQPAELGGDALARRDEFAGFRVGLRADQEEGGKPVVLKVNATYPNDTPLPTTPPQLLMNLPKLPEQLEYRIIGKNLIIRDVEANIIVDFVPNAIQ